MLQGIRISSGGMFLPEFRRWGSRDSEKEAIDHGYMPGWGWQTRGSKRLRGSRLHWLAPPCSPPKPSEVCRYHGTFLAPHLPVQSPQLPRLCKALPWLEPLTRADVIVYVCV